MRQNTETLAFRPLTRRQNEQMLQIMRKRLLFSLMVFAAAVFATVAQAERRIALVIGNSAYRNASALPNTINDANAIAALFRSVGFEVVSLAQRARRPRVQARGSRLPDHGGNRRHRRRLLCRARHRGEWRQLPDPRRCQARARLRRGRRGGGTRSHHLGAPAGAPAAADPARCVSRQSFRRAAAALGLDPRRPEGWARQARRRQCRHPRRLCRQGGLGLL